MERLDENIIKKINSYPKEKSNAEIGKELGIHRHTVARYRGEIADTLTEKPKEEKLTKTEKKKLQLLEHYTDKEIQDMLSYIATNTKKEVNLLALGIL